MAALVAGAAGEMVSTDGSGGAAPVASPAIAPLRVVTLTLNPEHLGRVTVTIRMSGERLSLRVEAEKSETARMIEGDQQALVESIVAEGYGVEELVTVALREPAPSAAVPAPPPQAGGDSAAGSRPGPDRQPAQHGRDERSTRPAVPSHDTEEYRNEEAAAPGRSGRLYV